MDPGPSTRLRRRVGPAAAIVLLVAVGAWTLLVDDAVPIAVDEPSDQGGAYAAAVLDLATEMEPENGKPWLVLYVVDHTCTGIVAARPCGDPTPLPNRLREVLAHDLASYAPVEFVRNHEQVSENGLVVNGGVVVTLGPLEQVDDRVSVPVMLVAGGLFAEGVEYHVTKSGDGYDAEPTDNRWIA